LQIGLFFLFYGGIVFAAELYQPPGKRISFFTDCAFLGHRFFELHYLNNINTIAESFNFCKGLI